MNKALATHMAQNESFLQPQPQYINNLFLISLLK